jgi:hypothetical protein
MLENRDITPLLRTHSPGSVSIYMSTDTTESPSRQDIIRFRNLLRQATSDLLALDLSSAQVETITEPGWAMLDNEMFWSRQEGGLAMFMAPGSYSHQRLPDDPGDRIFVDSRFHIRPLVEFLDQDRTYHVLALSLSGASLYRCQGRSLEEVPLDDEGSVPPPDARSAERDGQLQFHTGSPSGPGTRPALYHGHGSTQGQEREAILAFFRQVDGDIGQVLDRGDTPLVLAGVSYLWPLFRKVSSYPFIVDDGIEGSPESLTLEQIHERSREIVQPVFDEERRQALALYSDLRGTDMAHTSIEKALRSAFDGRVELLLVSADRTCHGAFDTTTRQVRCDAARTSESTELLNLASIYTLLRGGRVINVTGEDLADDEALAALLRY